MSPSLKGRMLTVLVLWIVVAWSAALIGVYAFTTYAQTSIWDERLQSVAIKLLQLLPDRGAESLEPGPRLQPPAGVTASRAELTFQVWRDRSHLLARTPGSPGTPLRADFADGFASVTIRQNEWRVYSVSDVTGRYHIQVGHPRATINADFQKHSLKAVSMATIPLALAGMLMWAAVSKTLKPLANIEAAARGRSRFDLTPLPATPLPRELYPLVNSFNGLLSQLDAAIRAERRFIGDAAHELRTPLSALQAQAEVALQARSDEERMQALTRLLAAAQRSSRLAEQLLDLARLEAGNHAPVREWFDLGEIVRHVVSEYEIVACNAQRSIDLVLEPCRIRCDIDEIGILVRNLIDNAVRYSSPGGKIRVRCGAAPEAFLEIADDGPGVPIESHSLIFERFHRGGHDSSVRGSGIGLSLVARIASAHHARIETGMGIGGRGLSVRVLFAHAGWPAGSP